MAMLSPPRANSPTRSLRYCRLVCGLHVRAVQAIKRHYRTRPLKSRGSRMGIRSRCFPKRDCRGCYGRCSGPSTRQTLLLCLLLFPVHGVSLAAACAMPKGGVYNMLACPSPKLHVPYIWLRFASLDATNPPLLLCGSYPP